MYRKLGEPQGRSRWIRKISPPPRFNARTIQLVANRYTDWAIPAHVTDYGVTTGDRVVTQQTKDSIT